MGGGSRLSAGGSGSTGNDKNKASTDKQRADKQLHDKNVIDQQAAITTAAATAGAGAVNKHMLVPGCRVECITVDNRGFAAQTRAR